MQIFFSLGITLLAYAMPTDTLNYLSFAENDNYNMENIGTEIEASLEQQTNIPVIELGALVFYSGNIVLDLLLNFLFAIPEMITMLINGVLFIINIDSFIISIIQVFAGVIVSVIQLLSILQLVLDYRSGSGYV